MENRVITIARSYGSGGRKMGRLLAKELGYEYYDREILRIASDESGISEELFNQVDERQHLPLFRIAREAYTGEVIPPDSDDFISNENLFRYQAKIIRELAATRNCVIVGRCADYVLRHRNPLRLFFYADIADRMERCRKRNEEQKSLNHDVLRKIITQTDKNRSRYYEFLSGQKWGAKENYDLCINTSSADTEKIIQCVISLL